MKEEPNLLYLKEISEGDLEFEKKLLEIVKKELPEEIKLYQNLLKNNNFNKAAEVVHKIKHKISILGLEKGYQVAIDYEEHLKVKNLELQNNFENMLHKMVNFINKL